MHYQPSYHFRKRRLALILILALLFSLTLLFTSRPAHAAFILVTTTNDEQNNNGLCSLREAIINANADDQSGSTDCVAGSGADTISFSGVSGTIVLNSLLPDLTTAITINGGGITVSGNNAVPVFAVEPDGNVALSGLTITGGRGTFTGGGIANSGTLTVSNCTFSGNANGNQEVGVIGGGAITNWTGGTLTISDSTFSGNAAGDSLIGGGAIANLGGGTLTISGSTFSSNAIDEGSYGGAIGNSGTLAISNSTFSGNMIGDSSYGGAIGNTATGTLTISSSTFSGNAAGNGSYGGAIANIGTLTISNSTFSGNRTGGSSYGGALDNKGTVTISSSTFSGNMTGGSSYGGAIRNGSCFSDDPASNMRISNSTFSGNMTGDHSFGGAIANIDNFLISFPGVHCTYSGAAATLLISESTVSGNATGEGSYGGGVSIYSGILNLGSTIVAGNLVGSSSFGPDISGFVFSSGDNLVGNSADSSGYVFGDQTGTSSSPLNPLLGALANNGGPTQTMALLAGSPAIDSGLPFPGGITITDQRGFPRPVDGDGDGVAGFDIGAYEASNTPAGANVKVQPSANPLVTVTFTGVTQEGTTSLSTNTCTTPPPPGGFQLGSPPMCFDLSTTAQFTPPVVVCINYSGVAFTNEANLKMLHYENGVWVDVTTSLDTVNDILCGEVTSLSPFGLFVPNQPPTANAGGPYRVGEGGTVELTGAGADPDGDSLSFAWDLDGDGVFETSGQAAMFSAAGRDGPDSQTVALNVCDASTCSTATTSVDIANIAPSVDAGQGATLIAGQTFEGGGSFSDPASADTFQALVDYGDGSGTQALALNGQSFTLQHLYGSPGTYSVTVQVIDDDGGTGTATTTVQVLSHQQAAAAIIDQVNDLIDTGSLNKGQGNALASRLEAAIASLNRGNTRAAINQLKAFINQVEAFVASGVLTPEEAQPLLDAANALIAAL